jgi:hypothetical protein
MTAELDGSYAGADLDPVDTPSSLEVLAAARGLDSDGSAAAEAGSLAGADPEHRTGSGKRNGKGKSNGNGKTNGNGKGHGAGNDHGA